MYVLIEKGWTMKAMRIGLLITGALGLALVGCGGQGAVPRPSGEIESGQSEQIAQQPVAIKSSPDKYTWYIKNYVGMNAASVGYTSMGGDRRDSYGAGTLKIVFRASDGAYLDIDDDESLKGYRVVGQDYEPNTEIKYTFLLDESGEEYENLVDSQNIDEIVLAVAPAGSNEPAVSLTAINPAPDKYTRYVKDYVGRNLATCGYISMGGSYNDHYGQGFIQFDIAADDGSYIDPQNVEDLQNYVVTGQSVEPNTPISMTFMKDSNGEEYSNLVETQSLESINLTVTRISEQE